MGRKKAYLLMHQMWMNSVWGNVKLFYFRLLVIEFDVSPPPPSFLGVWGMGEGTQEDSQITKAIVCHKCFVPNNSISKVKQYTL